MAWLPVPTALILEVETYQILWATISVAAHHDEVRKLLEVLTVSILVKRSARLSAELTCMGSSTSLLRSMRTHSWRQSMCFSFVLADELLMNDSVAALSPCRMMGSLTSIPASSAT